MSTDAPSTDKAQPFPLQDPAGDTDRASHVAHDPSSEIAHARQHFRENNRAFLGMFLPVILLTFIAFNVNFGNTPIVLHPLGFALNLGTGNLIAALVLAALRSACIAFFLAHLFKDFSFVFRTLAFTVFFLGGMIFLSLWDSQVLPGVVGDPIYDHQHPESMKN
jgi:hypothetical protein